MLLFIFGLLIGSFLAAFSYRLPKRISIAKGRSFCPNCKHQINWYDNIPLVSFIILRAKCRYCKKPISWRYPIIELAVALGFFVIGLNPLYLILFCILALIFIVDLEHQVIPDILVFAGIFFALFLLGNSIFGSVFAGFLSASLLMIIHLVTRGRGMGLGDVKFAILGGMLTGLNLVMVWLFASFLTGGIAGIILILGKRAGLKDKIAFGPFLVIGLLLTFAYGSRFLKFLGF